MQHCMVSSRVSARLSMLVRQHAAAAQGSPGAGAQPAPIRHRADASPIGQRNEVARASGTGAFRARSRAVRQALLFLDRRAEEGWYCRL